MSDIPDVKLKAYPVFPSKVEATSPILLTKQNGVYTLALDEDQLRTDIGAPSIADVMAATAAAAASAAEAEAAAGAIGNQVHQYDTVALAAGANIPSGVNLVRVLGYATAGDGGEALYKKVVSAPSHVFKFQSADSAWWEVVYVNGLNLRWGGAGLGNSATDTAAMASALTLGTGAGASLTGIKILLPTGTYTFTQGFLINRSSTKIIGDGPDLTWIRFNPTADANLFTIHNSASVGPTQTGIREVELRGFRIGSDDTTFQKVAINPQNADILYLKDIFIDDWDTTVGRSSIGILYQGRDFCRLENVDIFANNPIIFSQNPDRATYGAHIDSDFFHAFDCQFSVEPIDPTVLNPPISVFAGCNITRMRWTQVWVGGGGNGFAWVEDGSADQVSEDIVFDGFFDEQKQSSAFSTIFISWPTATTTLRQLTFQNIAVALEGNGIVLAGGAGGQIYGVKIDGLNYVGSNRVLQVDDGVRSVTWRNLFAPLASAFLSNQVLRTGGDWPVGYALPVEGSLAWRTRDQVVWKGAGDNSGYRSGEHVIEVTLATGNSFNLTPFSDYTVQTAMITVAGGVEAGCARFVRGSSLVKVYGTTNFAIVSTASSLCIVRTSDTSVQVVNTLGSTMTISIKVEFAAIPN